MFSPKIWNLVTKKIRNIPKKIMIFYDNLQKQDVI
jgi:hypothetical protein